MKNLISFLLLFAFCQLHAQTSADHKVTIVPCASGELFIDGSSAGLIDAEDASPQLLATGEHYLQLKTDRQKFNLTVTVNAEQSGIIRLGCVSEVKPAEISPSTSVLVDKQLNLSGSLGSEIEQDAVALDEGDGLHLHCAVLNKRGTATVWITSYPSGTELFRKEQFNTLEENIAIPSKGIYLIRVSTAALFGKDIKLTASRQPGVKSNPHFNTAVSVITDTLPVDVLTTTTRVYSMTNAGHPNKTSIKINLPANTTYWAYWLGVGQESREKMKSFITTLSSSAKVLSLNPVALFGLQLIPSLPMLNSTSTVNYFFTDSRNAQLYTAGQPATKYNFKYADHVSADYALIKTTEKDIVLALTNTDDFIGQDVEVRVVGFVVTPKWVMRE